MAEPQRIVQMTVCQAKCLSEETFGLYSPLALSSYQLVRCAVFVRVTRAIPVVSPIKLEIDQKSTYNLN